MNVNGYIKPFSISIDGITRAQSCVQGAVFVIDPITGKSMTVTYDTIEKAKLDKEFAGLFLALRDKDAK